MKASPKTETFTPGDMVELDRQEGLLNLQRTIGAHYLEWVDNKARDARGSWDGQQAFAASKRRMDKLLDKMVEVNGGTFDEV